jgi:signal transduction histidine kinase/DNA-binding response OmpR family regulator
MDLSDKLVAERRARLAAERLLELKSRELFAANRKLSEHARALSEEIIIQRRVVEDATEVAEALRGENERVRSDLDSATEARTVAEHRLWLALETIRDGFAIYDAAGRLVVANTAYLSVFDGLEEVGPGTHARDILRIGLEEGVFDPGGKEPAVWMESMLERWRHDVIEPRVIRLWNGHYIRLVDRRGNDGGVVCLALDITEAVRRERQLRDARAKAEAANRAKSAFLANMSHELRTPMNGVVGMAELMSETTLSEEQRLYAETIKSSGEALLLIINDVLDYSKLEAEKLTLKTETFDLERLLHEIITMLTPSASEKGLTLSVDYDLFLPAMLVGDRGRIRQILTNLAGNAVKFTETGHVLIRVVGAGREDGQQVLHIAVEDTGIGIAPEMQDHIFGEFNQVEDDRNRKFEGTGLGLAISRRLVRLMGGDIWLKSAAGEGSCFTFSMKLPVAEEGTLAVPALPERFARALLIDGDPVSRALLARQLSVLGVRVAEARNAAEAAELTLWEGADVVFADAGAVAAPGFPPQRCAAAPVVLLVASPGAATAAAATGRYAAVISRPSPRRELLDAVAAVAKLLAAAPAPAPPPPPPAAEPGPPRRLKVLAAEDNRTNQLVFSKMLKDLPVDITFAGNGREAVEAFGPLRPDIVFMDISMPEMGGKEATRRIRAEEAANGLPRTPVIALTAHALDGDQREILAAGLDKYLTKPLKKAAIHEAIEEACPGLLEAMAAEPPEAASGTNG